MVGQVTFDVRDALEDMVGDPLGIPRGWSSGTCSRKVRNADTVGRVLHHPPKCPDRLP